MADAGDSLLRSLRAAVIDVTPRRPFFTGPSSSAFDSSRCQNHLWVIHPSYPWRYQKNILQLDYKLFKRNKLCLLTFGSRKLIIVYRLYPGLYSSAMMSLTALLLPISVLMERTELALTQLGTVVSTQSDSLCRWWSTKVRHLLWLSFPPPLRNVGSSWAFCEQKNNLIWENLLFWTTKFWNWQPLAMFLQRKIQNVCLFPK